MNWTTAWACRKQQRGEEEATERQHSARQHSNRRNINISKRLLLQDMKHPNGLLLYPTVYQQHLCLSIFRGYSTSSSSMLPLRCCKIAWEMIMIKGGREEDWGLREKPEAWEEERQRGKQQLQWCVVLFLYSFLFVTCRHVIEFKQQTESMEKEDKDRATQQQDRRKCVWKKWTWKTTNFSSN